MGGPCGYRKHGSFSDLDSMVLLGARLRHCKARQGWSRQQRAPPHSKVAGSASDLWNERRQSGPRTFRCFHKGGLTEGGRLVAEWRSNRRPTKTVASSEPYRRLCIGPERMVTPARALKGRWKLAGGKRSAAPGHTRPRDAPRRGAGRCPSRLLRPFRAHRL